MIRCLHCREVFSDEYYRDWHVPCPQKDDKVDSATLAHLDAWLLRQFADEDEREIVRHKMVTLLKEDPHYWSERGWWVVHDRAMVA